MGGRKPYAIALTPALPAACHPNARISKCRATWSRRIIKMDNIKANLKRWDADYSWPNAGDEWMNQAEFCAQPYHVWKNALVKNFIEPYINQDSEALEIAPGHGRWTIYLAEKVRCLYLVDISSSCIEFCRERFNSYKNIKYFVNDGKSLACINNQSIDFIWSYDSFVHMDKWVIEAYMSEFSRILKRGSIVIIHHADKNHYMLLVKEYLLNYLGFVGDTISKKIFSRQQRGLRSDVSAKIIRGFAGKAKLQVVTQTDSWGESHEFNCKLFKDKISILEKPR
jgi:ubiquinone/menaquinone biosynthesis C-methylase UbiE